LPLGAVEASLQQGVVGHVGHTSCYRDVHGTDSPNAREPVELRKLA
jgi:hypothetical protein